MSIVSILSAIALSIVVQQASLPRRDVARPTKTKSLANGHSIALGGVQGAGMYAREQFNKYTKYTRRRPTPKEKGKDGPDQMIRSVIERVRRDRYKEEYNFSLALAEIEDREESAGTMNWPRAFDCLDDSEFEEHRQKLSDDEENRAMRDDSGSENCHSVSPADVGSGDESSEPEAEALPHFGFFRSPLRGRGPELEVWSDVSSDGEEPIDHAGFDNEDGCDSDDPDRMDICDSEDSGVGDHHNSATDVSYDHSGYEVDDEGSCDEPEISPGDLDDDLNGYEADIEDSCDHPNISFAANYGGSDADMEDNCSASEDEFNHGTQAMVVD